MKPLVDDALLNRYITDDCSKEEAARVEEWMNDPANRSLMRVFMESHWDKLEKSSSREWPMGHLLDKIYTNIEEPSFKTRSSSRSFYTNNTWLKVAASLIFILAIAGMIYHEYSPGTNPKSLTWQQQVSDKGKITTVTLADGTQVWLNAHSTLKYPIKFGNGTREVYLEGEAYFDVAEDKLHPFIVHTKDINIKVLGTAFTIKAYEKDQTSEATLVRGKVSVESTKGQHIELEPNERVVYSRGLHKAQVSKVVADNYTMWKDGTLLFDETPVENVIRTLERWYDVTIHVPSDQDMSCPLTARIETESLKEMLELLKSTTTMDYEIKAKDVFIKGTICD